jgi:ribose transport system substrate-binding protein
MSLKMGRWALSLALLVLGLIAGPAYAQDGGKPTIGYAVMGYDHPLFQAMKRGAEQEAKKLGVRLQPVDGKFDVNLQNSQIEDFISKKVDALLVNPVTAKETVPSLQKARAAGIPVVAIDTRPVGFQPDAFVTMNHYQGGYTIGWKIADDLDCKGTYAVIWAVGNEQAASRLRGFRAGMREECQVTGQPFAIRQVGAFSGITGPLRDTARKITETLLTKYPKGQLSFIFGQTDEFANGAYLATQSKDRPDVRVYGMDNNDDIRKFIDDKKNLLATTVHLPVQVGGAAVDTAAAIVAKKPHLKEIQLNFQLDDQSNIKLDPGWAGRYQPSFSQFFYPQQVAGLSGASAEDGAAPPPAAATQASEGSSTVWIVLVVVLALALVGTLLWTRARGRRAPLGPPARR